MSSLYVTLAIYRGVLIRAATLSLESWPVFATVFAYFAAFTGAAIVLAPLGLVGGLLLGLIQAACLSSFLHLVEQIVRGSRLTVQDFGRSFGAYLWDVIGVLFLVWIVQRLLLPVVLSTPQGLAIFVSIQLVAFVLFNAVPELIYLGHHSLFELLGESYRFITENWIEWFPPNILLGAGMFLLLTIEAPGILGFAVLALVSLYLYFAMVARGLLFLELNGTTRRSREFRYRSGS